MPIELEIVTGARKLSQATAELFVHLTQRAVREKGMFSVALAGGSTPQELYELLADEREGYRDKLSWDKIQFFWGDERHVPPDSIESNYRMATEAMLTKVPVPSENVHRIKSENTDAATAANEYEQKLREVFNLGQGELPCFDLVLLGLGTDGHTASIFPYSEVLNEKSRLMAAPWVKQLNSIRITMTLPVINNAACIIFLVSGSSKAEILRDVLQTDRTERLPAQFVNPTNGRLLWIVDESAAQFL